MRCFTEKDEKTCDGPEAVVRHSIVAPKLGTQANPIVIGDNPLGSVSNPFVIHVDESWCSHETDQLGSDADTWILTTPELRGTLTGENVAVLVDEGAPVDSSSIRAPFEQSTLKLTEDSFDASQNCSGIKAARSENVVNDQADSEQGAKKVKIFETEEPSEARIVPETSSMTLGHVTPTT
ncbi:hypothetical protein IFM47457_10307 [Aspergillus lentulus]|nr:hypothetical protein IFM47457_10307 [Aspergillus lentulus]